MRTSSSMLALQLLLCIVFIFSSIASVASFTHHHPHYNAHCISANQFHPVQLSPTLQVYTSIPYVSCKSVAAAYPSLLLGHGAPSQRRFPLLLRATNSANDSDSSSSSSPKKRVGNPFQNAIAKFKSKPVTYCLIPCIAALVGWFTNYLAVQMIFYPIQYRGFFQFRPEEPMGLLGWQGIVPCKTRKMSEAMVQMVTTQLLSVSDVFYRLDPRQISNLLGPTIPDIAEDVVAGVSPRWALRLLNRLPPKWKQASLVFGMKSFLFQFTQQLQANIQSVFSIRNCVVDQMLADRSLLGKLFYRCGSKELQFLTDSGLWFGFLLGILQMIVALFYDNPWSLSIGGAIVGFATNWLALKWIFEPVNPTKVGPFVFQGLFLRRQKEVAAEFSSFFANKILNSEKVWNSILTDPATLPNFNRLFTNQLSTFVTTLSPFRPQSAALAVTAATAIAKLPSKVFVLHNYIDTTLNLRESLRISMEQMTSAQFERVLHPIFEEDEFTLIVAGAVLGFAAGLIQQGIETGKIQLPSFRGISKLCVKLWSRLRGKPLLKEEIPETGDNVDPPPEDPISEVIQPST